ncbi:TM0106 family RecB-like putative nuclease [Oerskovia flava]|uniref:TM0106 family RecB-like putative nuclease n=1 Tax=Oerskovia flava TaxID=2986422 RepID=UPI002AD2A94A|nr:TM0106 family RecB-like putative nuclease [Oerskovia sp. JB1-3-2]
MFLVDEPLAPRADATSSGTAPGTSPGGAAVRTRTLVHSVSDLVVAAECEYRLLCRLDETLGRVPAREPGDDAMLDRTAALGERHELAVLADLERQHGPFDPATGRGVVRIEPARRSTYAELADAHAHTLAALEAGADVVYQAVLFDGEFSGRADFLVRRGAAYTVVDTKLARRAKVPALLQVGAYADQLLAAGVPVAPTVSLVLGAGTWSDHRVADVLPVYRDRRARLTALTAAHLARTDPAPWDDPDVQACGRCDRCGEQVAARRDVLLVGGVYETQRERLRGAGITTIDELAAATTGPADMPHDRFVQLRRQAALQLGDPTDDAAWAHGTVRWADASGPRELAWRIDDPAPVQRLPPPSAGDLFFDFEGDPLWSDDDGTDWGIDYLFGWVERPSTPGADPPFHALWAHDLVAERDALIAFVDHVADRRRTHPDLHVYHYAAYEKTHLLAIAARHGVYEEEVDDLLRDGVLVDLYAVVRQSLHIANKSRSIKKLEPLYMGDELRTGDVTDAAASVVAYAEYCALRDAGRAAEADALLRGIADYNRYDCVSTLRLLEWLQGAVQGADRAEPVRETALGPVTPPTDADPALPAEPSAGLVLEEEIRGVIGEDRARRDDVAQALAMYGAAVGYYRREAKPFWHEHFSRLTMPVDEWLGRRNAFHVERAEVVSDWSVEPGRRNPSRLLELTGRLPEGTDLRAGAAPYLLYDPPLPPCAKTSADGSRGWLTGASVLAADRRATTVGERDVLRVREQLPGGAEPFDAVPMALTPAAGPGTAPLEAATEGAARSALERWRADGSLPRGAASDILRRTPPRLLDGAPLPTVEDGDLVTAITAALVGLDESYVAVQGPPGTGKTYVGSRVVARLVESGWRVGVVAQSHAVVENMLRAVVAAGVRSELVAKKRAADGSSDTAVCAELAGPALAAFAAEPGPRVVGGTAWDFAGERMPPGGLDLLVIDEAGQFALASTVAVARSAQRLLLLGDPQQLPQVSQGTHPEPVDRSALGWLTDGHDVLPADRGYFLPTTWRMHPALAAAVSALSYEDRLHAHPVAAARDLDGARPGIHHVPVEHRGNQVRSREEADEVVRQVERFLGRAWTAAGVTRPLDEGDVLVVAAYNAQVRAVRQALAAAGHAQVQVGTVDKFQGREAPVVIVTFAASSAGDVPRGMGFLLSRNRVNVAVSRAQWCAVVVRSPALTQYLPHSPRGLEELGAFIGLCERGDRPGAEGG